MRAWLVLLIGCGRVAFEPQPPPPIPDAQGPDLVRFPMDDDPAAGSLTAIPAAWSVACGAMCPAAATGIVGTGAYQFDGTQRIELGDLIPASRPLTITLWLQADPSIAFASVLSKPYNTTSLLNDFSLTVYDVGWSCEGAIADAAVGVTDPADLQGAWHHVAMTLDGPTRSIYLDGTFHMSGTGDWQTSSLPVAIGADLDNGAFNVPFIGLMDDLRFYPRVLTAVEIFSVYGERL